MDLIGSRQKLSSDYINLFEDVRQYRDENNSTWETAMGEVLPKHAQPNDDIEDNQIDILKEILSTLKRIEQKL